jgi:hypothetical protein
VSEQTEANRGACAKCVHFRRTRLASQLLAAAFQANTDGAEIASALAKIVDDEHKLREAEAETKGKEGSANRGLWNARPMTSDFCGLEEPKEVYRIAEVKNRDLRCGDFEPGKPERRACEDCAHRVSSQGKDHDYEMEVTFTRLLSNAVAARASSQSAEGLLQSYRAGEASRKALEISAAYESKGRLMAKPEYLDHCAALSTEDEYVVCVLQNPHHTCPAWEPKATNGGDSQ